MVKEIEYEVEKIVNKKRNLNGVILYEVKWLGYPEDQNTWEPLSHLTKVKKMIAEFEKIKGKEIDEEWKKGKLDFDKPKKIIGIQLNNNKLLLKIRWKKRFKKMQPKDTFIEYNEIKNKYPHKLLKFFEKNIRLIGVKDKKLIFNPNLQTLEVFEGNELEILSN